MDFCTGNIHINVTQFSKILLWGEMFEKPWQMFYQRKGKLNKMIHQNGKFHFYFCFWLGFFFFHNRIQCCTQKLWQLFWVKAWPTKNHLEDGWKIIICQYRFLHLDLINLDAEQLVLKFIVEIEPVSVLNLFPTGVLVENASFSAG